jgi:hypothetical protein
VLPDPDDRHVLAVAIRSNASVIVTFNQSDFPAITLEPLGIEAGGVETKAAVMCHASVASNTYDKMYRYSGEERVVCVPTADHNSQLINKAVNEVRRRRVAGTRLRPPRPAYGLDYQMTRCVRRTFEFPNRNE